MPSYLLNANVTWAVGEVADSAVGSGTRWRRSRANGNTVTNHERVVACEDLLDEEPHEPLPLHDVERLGRPRQARQKHQEGFGETQMRGTVASLFHPRVQLLSQRLLALTQQRPCGRCRHPTPRDESQPDPISIMLEAGRGGVGR